jgi:hypothetical protein
MLTITRLATPLIATAAIAGLIGGHVFAADADRLATTGSTTDMKGVYVGHGENAEAMARAGKLGITKFEDEDKEGGGGAPQKTLIDNDAVKVNLVAFKKGFVRAGGVRRRYDTLLVYIDRGDHTILASGAGQKIANPVMQRLLPGSAVFHLKDSVVPESRIDEDYRVLFIMMKR